MQEKKLKFVLMWHMHQPHYQDGLDGEYRLPWVYLHAVKDYTDMVAHLEANPQARVVVNFAPVLLEQLKDYEKQFKDFLKKHKPFKDPLLNLFAGVTSIGSDLSLKKEIVHSVLRLNRPTLLDPYESFRDLIFNILGWETDQAEGRLAYLSEDFFLDILTWYHLVWTGESLRRAEPRIEGLIRKGRYFSQEDRLALIRIYYKAISEIIERYKTLAEAGQIEISMTPYGHPIVPLLMDFHAMDCAQPEDPKPRYEAYPGGHERVNYHFEEGLKIFHKHFGFKPKGIWLSEGAISQEAVGLLDKYGYQWTASGQAVWANSCRRSGLDPQEPDHPKLFNPYKLNEFKPYVFFRDDGLSDLIGFKYQSWFAPDAVGDFIHHLENIYHSNQALPYDPVVSVILDGENAWDFLCEFYDRLSNHPFIEMTTFDQVLNAHQVSYELKDFCPGSWVYGSFSTWIGSEAKNAAWDRLIEAKKVFDQVYPTLDKETQFKAARQMAICESSDWFWWFGDYNPASSVQDFDALFRRHLQKLYQILGCEVPANLASVISQGNENASGHSGTMRANT